MKVLMEALGICTYFTEHYLIFAGIPGRLLGSHLQSDMIGNANTSFNGY